MSCHGRWAVSGWIAGASTGTGFVLVAAANPYIGLSVLLGGVTLTVTVIAAGREQRRR